MSTGAKAGISIVVILLVGAICAYLFVYRRRQEQSKKRDYSNIAKLAEPLLEEGNDGANIFGETTTATEMRDRASKRRPSEIHMATDATVRTSASDVDTTRQMSSGDAMFKVMR